MLRFDTPAFHYRPGKAYVPEAAPHKPATSHVEMIQSLMLLGASAAVLAACWGLAELVGFFFG